MTFLDQKAEEALESLIKNGSHSAEIFKSLFEIIHNNMLSIDALEKRLRRLELQQLDREFAKET